MEARGVMRQKIPEQLELMTELPRNATGKVRKDLLRQRRPRLNAALTGLPGRLGTRGSGAYEHSVPVRIVRRGARRAPGARRRHDRARRGSHASR